MLGERLLQQGSWSFDLTSALIGAIFAWLIAAFLYAQRTQIQHLRDRIWAPVANWRRRMRASQEEKYLKALQKAVKDLLLFAPLDPSAIFRPPTFLAPGQLSTEPPEGGHLPKPVSITFEQLTEGYGRILIKGAKADGRTTTLAMVPWLVARQDEESEVEKPYRRIPVWIDVTQLQELPEDAKSTSEERLAQLANRFLPSVVPKWLLAHLRSEPSVILIDNWASLSPDERHLVAVWIADVAQALPESKWIVATGPDGYGPLVEAGFVPLTLVPASSDAWLPDLYRGWASLLDKEELEPPEEVLFDLRWAQAAGAPLVELNVRTVLYLQSQQLPIRPVDVMDFMLDNRIPMLDLGEGQEEVAAQARLLTLETLSHIARTHRLERHALTRDEVLEYIGTLLPPEEERPPKLEGAVRKLIGDTGLVHREGKAWTLNHYIWEEFLTAWTLVEDEMGMELVESHLYDPSWRLLLEFYVGLRDATPLVRGLLQTVIDTGDVDSLLRAARWSVIAQEEAPWKTVVMKALAQHFVKPLDSETRLRVGRALTLVAGEGARAFFLKALRHPSLEVRQAALRGIGWAGTPREMVALEGALKDDHLEIRQSAVEALADMGTPGAVRILKRTLEHGDEHLVLTVAEALTRLPEGQDVLREATESSDLLVRRSAAHGMGLLDEPWATEKLEMLAREDPQWLVRSAADMSLKMQKEQHESRVTVSPPPQIDQIDWLIAWAAQRGEGLGVGDAAMQMLTQAISEGEPETQILAALTLARVGQERHLDVLYPLEHTADPDLRNAVALAIQEIEERYPRYGAEVAPV